MLRAECGLEVTVRISWGNWFSTASTLLWILSPGTTPGPHSGEPLQDLTVENQGRLPCGPGTMMGRAILVRCIQSFLTMADSSSKRLSQSCFSTGEQSWSPSPDPFRFHVSSNRVSQSTVVRASRSYDGNTAASKVNREQGKQTNQNL